MFEKVHEKIDGVFNIDLMFEFAKSEIQAFALKHSNEAFYGFAIDCGLLCLNSVEQFQKTLSKYKTDSPKFYQTKQQKFNLQWNTGDWAYIGFSEFGDDNGFNSAQYDSHYKFVMELVEIQSEQQGFAGYGPLDIPDGASTTPYAKAIDALLLRLIKEDAFTCLKRTPDFNAVRVEHSY